MVFKKRYKKETERLRIERVSLESQINARNERLKKSKKQATQDNQAKQEILVKKYWEITSQWRKRKHI